MFSYWINVIIFRFNYVPYQDKPGIHVYFNRYEKKKMDTIYYFNFIKLIENQ